MIFHSIYIEKFAKSQRMCIVNTALSHVFVIDFLCEMSGFTLAVCVQKFIKFKRSFSRYLSEDNEMQLAR